MMQKDIILEHGKSPRNFGKCEGYNHDAKGYNPLCGDKYELQMIVEEGLVKSLKYRGSGCSISKASTAVLCENLNGKNQEEVLLEIQRFLELVDSDSDLEPDQITSDETLLAFAAAREFPERKSCADLSWKEVQKQFNQLFPNHSKE